MFQKRTNEVNLSRYYENNLFSNKPDESQEFQFCSYYFQYPSQCRASAEWQCCYRCKKIFLPNDN